jgi:hypothetical protein
VVLFTQRQQLFEDLRRRVQEAVLQQSDPAAQRAGEWLLSPAGLAFVVTIVAVMFFFLFVVCGTLGGTLWGSLGASRERRPQL